VSGMSSSLFDYDMTPEEAMSILKMAVVDNWLKKADARKWEKDIWLSESAYEALDYLEHGQVPDVLADLSGYSLDDVKRMWSMISERQREKVIHNIKREIAEMGLMESLPLMAGAVALLVNRGKEGVEAVKRVLQKAYDFMDGKTSFDDLMNAVGQLPPFNESQKAYELLVKGAALGKYLTRTELKKLLAKHFIAELENTLPYHE